MRPGKGRPLITHGHTVGRKLPRTYMIWRSMRQRCERPADSAYADYGGRGIKVCVRWQDYANFLADMGEAPEGLTLERRDVNGNYAPSNCEWATRTTQARNTRRAQKVMWQGKLRSVFDLAEEHGLIPNTVVVRLARGWSIERALTPPKSRNDRP